MGLMTDSHKFDTFILELLQGIHRAQQEIRDGHLEAGKWIIQYLSWLPEAVSKRLTALNLGNAAELAGDEAFEQVGRAIAAYRARMEGGAQDG